MTCVPRKHTITPSRHLPASTPPIYRVAYNAGHGSRRHKHYLMLLDAHLSQPLALASLKCLLTSLSQFLAFPYYSALQRETYIQIIARARFLYAIAQQDVESACQSLEASPQLPSLLFSRSGAASADSRDGAGKAGEAEIVKEESMVCDRCGREDFKNMQVLVPAFPRTVSELSALRKA